MKNGIFDQTGVAEADIFGVLAPSSRGPTSEGRIKPDIAAPGWSVLSSLSRDYAGSPSPPASYGTSTNPLYCFKTGTSMVSPTAAGYAAILREALANIQTIANPSAALLEALLVNGAVAMPRPPKLPSQLVTFGFGRVNLGDPFPALRPRRQMASSLTRPSSPHPMAAPSPCQALWREVIALPLYRSMFQVLQSFLLLAIHVG